MAVTPLQNETELLAKIALGDQRAFAILFKHYHKYVFEFSRNITRSEDMAGEIVQDIFLKIWLSREKLSEIKNFGAYLNRSVRNHSFNTLRKIVHEKRSAGALKLSFIDRDDSTTQELDYRETESILFAALETLSPQQKMVYNLCHQQGLKYDEAASRMEISPQTVHAYMKEALKKIREHFKKNSTGYAVLITVLFK